MLGRVSAVFICVALAACAGLEPAGRNASRSPQPAPPPPVAAPAPVPAAAAPPSRAVTPAPAPTVLPTPASPPAPAAAPPPPVATPAPVVAPPTASPPPTPAPPPAPAATSAEPARVFSPNPQDDTVVVPGQVERQIAPPNGDPRSNAERMQDVRAWDQCVMRVQSAYDSDPMRPQLTSPEEYCARSLGMSDRTAIPLSRLQR